MKPKDALGKYGEELATRYLTKNGMVILERNWRCDIGELDVIARDKDDLVICEVKTRRSTVFGEPIEAVTPRKVRRMRGLALRWLETKSVSPRGIRFDVVGVLAPVVGPPTITHIRGV
ncbi:MAG: YraN family protein [Actinomycetia bacterium]|nr:YraN family protein [Actinomycetes bacterium]